MEDSERRKAIELLKEMRSENKTTDDKSANQETHLNWMYKGPSDLIDREEYLLGKAIDKNFEVLSSGDMGSSDIGRTGEQSNVPKRLLEKTDNLEQVDVAKKILEDPLYAIKQKEMEARKKLLNNPVKLKQIKQMLLERHKQSSSHKLKKKKKKSKHKSEQELNILILKKLAKFTDKEKRKALNKVLKSEHVLDSSDSGSSDNKKEKKPKVKRKRSYSSSSSDSSSDSSSSNNSSSNSEKLSKNKRKKSESNKKKRKRKNEESSSNSSSSSSSSSSDDERTKNSKSTTLNSKHHKKSSTNEKIRKSQEGSQRSSKNSPKKNKKRDLEENNNKNRDNRKINKGKRDSYSDEERRSKKNYGLTVPEGFKPEKRKREFPVEKYQKSAAESKTKYVPPPKVKPLSDKEREEKLKEMMEDAKLRKEDREKNLANHRKKQILEEQSKTYDDDFMRRQMSHLTSLGTMADRIKSNINNIQRSKTSMDTNFMRK